MKTSLTQSNSSIRTSWRPLLIFPFLIFTRFFFNCARSPARSRSISRLWLSKMRYSKYVSMSLLLALYYPITALFKLPACSASFFSVSASLICACIQGWIFCCKWLPVLFTCQACAESGQRQNMTHAWQMQHVSTSLNFLLKLEYAFNFILQTQFSQSFLFLDGKL